MDIKSLNEIKIYIGANNTTHKIDKKYMGIIENFFNDLYPTIEGYTLTKGIGYFNSKREDSIIVTIITDSDLILNPLSQTLIRLKQLLNQNEIIITETVIMGVMI